MVVRVMRLGTEKVCISSLPASITWWNRSRRTEKLKPAAVRADRYPQPTASTALHSVHSSISPPTDRISPVLLPGVLLLGAVYALRALVIYLKMLLLNKAVSRYFTSNSLAILPPGGFPGFSSGKRYKSGSWAPGFGSGQGAEEKTAP